MTDPRLDMRALYARWLRVRANVRKLAHSLAAAELGLQRDAAHRSDEPEVAVLVAHVQAERAAVTILASELDARISAVKLDCDAIEADYVRRLIAGSRRELLAPAPNGARLY